MLIQLAQQGLMRYGAWALVISLALVTIQVASVSGQTLTDGLQAYWPLDGNANDAVGGLNLTGSSGTSFDAGIVGQSAKSTEINGKNLKVPSLTTTERKKMLLGSVVKIGQHPGTLFGAEG